MSKSHAKSVWMGTLICAASLIIIPHFSWAAPADDVFIDEGDAAATGDVHTAKSKDSVADEIQTETAVPQPEDTAPGDDVVKDALKAHNQKHVKAETEHHDVAVPTTDTTPEVAHVEKPAKTKHASGLFVTTKEACSMLREPASTSEPMLTVKPSKKIWVEEVDSSWVRGFNKAGEPGYIKRDCVN